VAGEVLVNRLEDVPGERDVAGCAVPGAGRGGPGARQEGKSQDGAEDRRAERGAHLVQRLARNERGLTVREEVDLATADFGESLGYALLTTS
jgi:hypothetical protein